MDNFVFVKHTVDMQGTGSGYFGGYSLGSLFLIKRTDVDLLGTFYKLRGLVLDDKFGVNRYYGDIYSINAEELTVVNNDKDLEECVRIYEELKSRDKVVDRWRDDNTYVPYIRFTADDIPF